MEKNYDLIHYDTIDINEIPSILKNDWGIPINEDLESLELSSDEKALLRKAIELINNKQEISTSSDDEADLLALFRNPSKEYGIVLFDGTVSTTLNLEAAITLGISFIYRAMILKEDIQFNDVVRLMRNIAKFRFHKDGQQCVLCQAMRISGNNPFKDMSGEELHPYISEYPNRFCSHVQSDGKREEAFCHCRLYENGGCQLTAEEVKKIVQEFVDNQILIPRKGDPNNYRMAIVSKTI